MKNLFLFATAAAVLCSCSNQPKYIIDGDIAGLEGTVYQIGRASCRERVFRAV